jgi:hypothetical protein
MFISKSFKENLSGFFLWDLPVIKISPEWVTGPEQGKSSGRIAIFSLWTDMFRDGISSSPGETVTVLWLGLHFLVCENRLYHKKAKTTVGRIGFSIARHYPLYTNCKGVTPIFDRLLKYKRNWIQRVNRMPCNRLPRVVKQYCPTGRRNHGRPLKRLLVSWDRNRSASSPTPWQVYDDDKRVLLTEYILNLTKAKRKKLAIQLHFTS